MDKNFLEDILKKLKVRCGSCGRYFLKKIKFNRVDLVIENLKPQS